MTCLLSSVQQGLEGQIPVNMQFTVSPAELLPQKQELLDRAAFWTDLAASMSHEVRNPLVAIKTFAQLLPERFDDPDFRRDFNEIVVQEIDRLDLLITQINNFAHPPELLFKPLDLRTPMKKAIEIVRSRRKQNGFSVETNLPDDLPAVVGDETALAEAFRPPRGECRRGYFRPAEGENHSQREAGARRRTY